MLDVAAYIAVFNVAVRSGDWASVLDQFTDDATMQFVGPPVGPFVGRQAIADAYATSPPDDTIEILGASALDDGDVVASFRWQRGGETGTMRFTEQAGRVHRLVISFD